MNIITLTVNPALDKSAKVNGVIPSQKLKCHSIAYQPGGGGINISRLLKRLDIETKCIVPLGGDTGSYFEELLVKENIQPVVIPVKAWTRENLAILDTQTGQQYRFGMPGNEITNENNLITNTIDKIIKPNDVFVISGSLAPGLPTRFFAQLIRGLSGKQVKVIIDTSGKPLMEALKETVYLIKPNQRELAQLAGKSFLSNKEQEAFALDIVANKKAEYVAVSLGARGAFLASKQGVIHQTTPSIKVKSTIGAGDSMVAGLIYGIINGYSLEEKLKMGIACGVATTMSEGTNLASVENINNVLQLMSK